MTSDSFSDGGRFASTEHALEHALNLVKHGAEIVDIGGESTRPGATPVTAQQEMDRVLPVVEHLRAQSEVLISVDTTKSGVAAEAVKSGADIINDVSGGQFDTGMIDVVKGTGAGYVCGHVLSDTLEAIHESQERCIGYKRIVETFSERIVALKQKLGKKIIADPCVGFGKSQETNQRLIRSGSDIAERTGVPVMIGVSRKRVLGDLAGLPLGERDHATVGASLAAVVFGASLLRVHNVKIMKEALSAFWPLFQSEGN